ncbi:insulin receptor substrate 2-B-like [Arapaima gigas]
MAGWGGYQESGGGGGGGLALERQQRALGAKTVAATADGASTGEPPASRAHQHAPPPYHHHLQLHHHHLHHHHLHHHHHQHGPQPQEPCAGDTGARRASSSGGGQLQEDVFDDIRKCGYLRKQKHGHKRFFVLRAASRLGPGRLEYYDSEKKFRNSLRCASGAEREQDEWYQALSDLMSESRRAHPDADELEDVYGAVSPGTVFKEVWQVHVKPKGLGQTKNLTGVYRLCLTAKTLHLVKLNSEMPCVNLQLMNIRRCGHSESFFFIEVGRSSSTGPGEIWMQVDDSVVAQSMHETILETMKALKAFADFRPRSKSQSSGSNPVVFVTTRRHLGNLPPSQTGLQRRSRTESAAGTPPGCKGGGGTGAYRFRTSSEGEGTMNRPFRSAAGGLVHLSAGRANQGRQDASGRYSRAPSGSSYHVRSASLPVSRFSYATSPVSVSSSSGHGSASDTLTRPSSASLCGSPSDGGFNSSDEYGSSPGDLRYIRVRSSTPDSMGNTPPICEESCLRDYLGTSRHRDTWGSCEPPQDEACDEEKALWKQTHASTRPVGGSTGVTVYQKMTQTSSSLDESVSSFGSYVKPLLCTDQQAIPSRDDGYVAMVAGFVPSRDDDYMLMQPSTHHPSPPHLPALAPASPQQVDPWGYMMMLPSGMDHPQIGEYADECQSCLLVPGQRFSRGCHTQTPPESPRPYSPYFSLPRSYKAPVRESREREDYVSMSSPSKAAHPTSEHGRTCPSCVLQASDECTERSCSDQRALRPTRLPLGLYDFHDPARGRGARQPPSGTAGYINVEHRDRPSESSVLSRSSAVPDCARLEADGQWPKVHYPRPSLVAPWNPPSYIRPHAGAMADSYVDTGVSLGTGARSPSGVLRQLCVAERDEPRTRLRRNSDTLSSAPPEGHTLTPACPYPADGAKWHGSAPFDATWLRAEDAASPGSVGLPVPPDVSHGLGGHVCRNSAAATHQLGVNYIALDLRDGSWASRDVEPPVPTTPPTPLPLPENGAYASLEFATADRLTSASQGW